MLGLLLRGAAGLFGALGVSTILAACGSSAPAAPAATSKPAEAKPATVASPAAPAAQPAAPTSATCKGNRIPFGERRLPTVVEYEVRLRSVGRIRLTTFPQVFLEISLELRLPILGGTLKAQIG